MVHYFSRSAEDRLRRIKGTLSPLQSIKAFFDEIVDQSLIDTDRKGCMLVNSTLEIAAQDLEFKRVVGEELVKLEGYFGRCVAAGRQPGEISSAQPTQDFARLLLAILQDIRVLARSRPEPASLDGPLRSAIALLDGRPVRND